MEGPNTGPVLNGSATATAAINRTSRFAFVQRMANANRVAASAFCEALAEALPYEIYTARTDNSIQFRCPPRYFEGPTARLITHTFGMRCQENGIEHRCTKVTHPRTNGQVARMNRTIRQATVQRYHCDDHA